MPPLNFLVFQVEIVQATEIDVVTIRRGPGAGEGMDAAGLAEVVVGGFGIELV